MKLWRIPALAVMVILGGCDGNEVPNSGTITLDNELYESGSYYYSLGLSFAEGKAVPTLPEPNRYDIIVQAGNEPFLSANTLEPAFALKGEYGSESEAINAFDALVSVGTVSYIDLALPLKANQVWVIRTRDNKYAKIRTITVSYTSGSDPFASCKFEWVFQPDGSTQFP